MTLVVPVKSGESYQNGMINGQMVGCYKVVRDQYTLRL